MAFLDKHYFSRKAIITLRIPENAIICGLHPTKKRSNVAIVEHIQELDAGTSIRAYSTFDLDFEYKVGCIVSPAEDFCTDLFVDTVSPFYLEPPREEQISCQSGIHFFLTRAEAIEYARRWL